MNKFEFLGYQETPDDKYGMLGLATVRVNVPVILKFKKVKTKDGTGTFFASASYSIEQNGQKKYLDSHMVDSRGDDEQLKEFLREHVDANCHVRSVNIQQIPKSMKEVANQQELPF